MKRLAFLLLLVSLSPSVRAQGFVILNNRIGTLDARISVVGDGRGAGTLQGAQAQLFLVGAGGVLTPLAPATTFRTGANPAVAYYLNQQIVTVPGIAPGQPATFRVGAWAGGPDFFSAPCWGMSNDIYVEQLGGTVPGGAPIPDAILAGMLPFYVCVPEPSSIAVGIFGAAAFLSFAADQRPSHESGQHHPGARSR